jgi:hypothetical protein
MEPDDPVPDSRGGCLVLVLGSGLAGFLLVAAIIVTGGLVIFFLVPVGLLIAFIGLNYLLWGWTMRAPARAEPAVREPVEEETAPSASEAITELAPDDPRRARHE